ncbi:hypothetical protein E2562_018946 [Oryza meyeriana var. granulata]|uniref:Uncharacterized protein n=1 Tax=Oryza meyeriana var. granulata TaxID=110450 RepID=A0A6G1DIQ2_9ORYZ|nr:hypothetical protein E2562_018946 [Oryza meyeriana var. granulata]
MHLEILMPHRLRHVTSAVASVRVKEGSAHDGGAVRTAVARLLSLFVSGAGGRGMTMENPARRKGRLASGAMSWRGEDVGPLGGFGGGTPFGGFGGGGTPFGGFGSGGTPFGGFGGGGAGGVTP